MSSLKPLTAALVAAGGAPPAPDEKAAIDASSAAQAGAARHRPSRSAGGNRIGSVSGEVEQADWHAHRAGARLQLYPS